MAEAPKTAHGGDASPGEARSRVGDDLVFADAISVEVVKAVDSGANPSPPVVAAGFPFDPLKQKADTARNIAYALVAILGVSVLVHYVVIGLTPLPPDKIDQRLEAFKAAFNAWLPVASGLVSAAVTYYFTRDRDDKKS